MQKKTITSWPFYCEEDIQAVSEVLRSNMVNYWTGQEGRMFEEEFAAWVGVNHAIAVANGTVALEVALKALGVGPGDEVVVTPRTYIATVSSIVITGATPVFADVDIDSQNITVTSIRSVLTSKTRAIICVHLFGWPCEMDGIMALAEERGLYLIEDCAQAHGASYRGKSVGSIGHVGAWSFCNDKIITTGGEGGMVTTNSYELWSKMWSYKEHGKSFELACKGEHSSGFRWVHTSFGSNMRITEIQAAIGRRQLKRMSIWHEARNKNANAIGLTCSNYPQALRITEPPEYVKHAWYKYCVFIRPDGLSDGWSRDRIIEEINALGVPCSSGICPEVYLEKAFEDTAFKPPQSLSCARELGQTSLMFLVHPTLTRSDVSYTCNAISRVMDMAVC